MNTKELVTNHLFLQTMKPEHLETIAHGAREIEFEANQLVFREGEVANQFYLIVRGKVALETHPPGDEVVQVQSIGDGDVLGWSWLFPPFVWHFQARALEPVKAIMLDGGHLLVACEEDHDLGYELMKRFSQVIIQRLQQTRQQCLAHPEKLTRFVEKTAEPEPKFTKVWETD